MSEIINDNCVQWMQRQAQNSIDAIVTDPPYGLEFMAAEWDTFKVRLPREVLNYRRVAHLSTVERLRREDVTDKAQLELLVYQEWTRQWALEAIRILKPGAYMLVMSGTRTHHRMTCGLEDAGFLIRDCLCWVYASGFPKSYNLSKGFDKKAGVEREVIGIESQVPTRPVTDKWDKSAHRELDANPFSSARQGKLREITEPATPLAQQWDGWGTALKPAWEPIIMAQKPLEGNYCQNVERWGVGGLNIDACRVPYRDEKDLAAQQSNFKGHKAPSSHSAKSLFTDIKDHIDNLVSTKGRFPANVQVDSTPDGLLAEYTKFFIIPKASKRERNEGLEQLPDRTIRRYGRREAGSLPQQTPQDKIICKNHHPTVKPIRLFVQMIKLVTPPGGMVLDPFLGSGTCCLAAEEAGVQCIGIERSEEYCKIARQRVEGGDK